MSVAKKKEPRKTFRLTSLGISSYEGFGKFRAAIDNLENCGAKLLSGNFSGGNFSGREKMGRFDWVICVDPRRLPNAQRVVSATFTKQLRGADLTKFQHECDARDREFRVFELYRSSRVDAYPHLRRELTA